MRITAWTVPILVIAAVGAGLGGSRLFVAPSYDRSYPCESADRAAAALVTSRFTVQGLRCVDTARTLSGLLTEVPGVVRCVCYASRNEARVTYDPALADTEDVLQAIEGPVFDSTSFRFDYGQFEVVEIDGQKVHINNVEEDG